MSPRSCKPRWDQTLLRVLCASTCACDKPSRSHPTQGEVKRLLHLRQFPARACQPRHLEAWGSQALAPARRHEQQERPGLSYHELPARGHPVAAMPERIGLTWLAGRCQPTASVEACEARLGQTQRPCALCPHTHAALRRSNSHGPETAAQSRNRNPWIQSPDPRSWLPGVSNSCISRGPMNGNATTRRMPRQAKATHTVQVILSCRSLAGPHLGFRLQWLGPQGPAPADLC